MTLMLLDSRWCVPELLHYLILILLSFSKYSNCIYFGWVNRPLKIGHRLSSPIKYKNGCSAQKGGMRLFAHFFEIRMPWKMENTDVVKNKLDILRLLNLFALNFVSTVRYFSKLSHTKHAFRNEFFQLRKKNSIESDVNTWCFDFCMKRKCKDENS